MNLKKLGKTDVKLPELGFGAAPFGGNYGEITQEECDEAVVTALKTGINYFDTSPYYGETRSETSLGLALERSGYSRDSFVVSTKVGRYGVATFDFSRERVLASIDESLRRLRLDHVDVLIAHDVEFCDKGPSYIATVTLPALAEIKARGQCKAIAISGLPLDWLDAVVKLAQPGHLDAVLSYAHLTVRDSTLLEYTAAWSERGLGVINASPLGMGLLTNAGPQEWHPASEEVKGACAKAAEAVAAEGGSLPGVAIRWSLEAVRKTSGVVASTLVGMKSSEVVHLNRSVVDAIAAAESGDKYAKFLSTIEPILKPVQGATWPSGVPL